MASPPSPSMAAPSMASPSIAPPLSELKDVLRQTFDVIAAFFALLCYAVFSILIVLDVCRAFKKRATWLPGKAFALTGVTVQIIVWWTSLSKLLKNFKNEEGFDDVIIYISLNQIVVSGRVAVCVFAGYLLPVMAAPSVSAFVTLGTAICIQIAYEIVLFSEKKSYEGFIENNEELNNEIKDFKNWAPLVDKIILICIIFLGLILGCTALAIKNIQNLLRQRISAIFSISEEDEFQFSDKKSISWNGFEDNVLGSWFVARVCRPDYVISRSVLSSAVGIIVTISVISSILSNTVYNIYFDSWNDPYIWVFVPLFSFIIIGWVFISWRWLAAQMHFRPRKVSWRRFLSVEDFWTCNIDVLIHMYDLQRDRQKFQDKERSSLSKLKSLPGKIFSKVFRLRKLFCLVFMLQVSVVILSKVCGLLSEVIAGKFVYWCRKHLKKGNPIDPPENYARILNNISMPGEHPSDLWEANKTSLKKVKLLIQKGCDKGRASEEINSIFRHCSVQWAEDGKELLNMLKEREIFSISEQIQCVKMIVVSLITIFIRLHKTKSNRLDKVLKACLEVWDLLSFVDDSDIDLMDSKISLLGDFNSGELQVCMAAEKEFYKQQMEYHKLSSDSEDCVIDDTEARRIIQNLSENCVRLIKRENLLSVSKDWMEIAPSRSLYKLCDVMLGKDIHNFVRWTEENLRNVIDCSMLRLPDMLLKRCWKWAEEFEEDKLWEVSHLAGKCRGMMEAWNLKPKPTMNTTKQWTLEVMDSAQFLADL